MEKIITSRMHKIVCCVVSASISLMVIADLIMGEDNVKMRYLAVALLLICIFLIYGAFTSRIRYTDTYMIMEVFWIRTKVLYKDISNVTHNYYVGSYWINTYDGRHFQTIMLMKKKEMKEMFDVVLKVNPKAGVYI